MGRAMAVGGWRWAVAQCGLGLLMAVERWPAAEVSVRASTFAHTFYAASCGCPYFSLCSQ